MFKNEKVIEKIETARSTKIMTVFERHDGQLVHRMIEVGHAYGVPDHIPDKQIKKYLKTKEEKDGKKRTLAL